MSLLEVDFGIKLTSDTIGNSLNKHWLKSFSNEIGTISFNLKKLEWISIQETTIWFGWMHQLNAKGKKVKVDLQSKEGLDLNSDNDRKVFIRRQRCISNLIYKSSFEKEFKDKIKYEITDLGPHIKYIPKTYSNIIPFYRILTKNENLTNSSEIFEVKHKSLFNEYPVDENIGNTLKDEGLNQIDNNALTYVITKELFTNTIQHAYINSEFIKESYFSLGYASKISNRFDNLDDLLEERINERHIDERDFFRRNGNKSFLEYTFIDFGIGIPSTLENIYKDKTSKLSDKQDLLYKLFHQNHTHQTLCNRIIEYAFLLFTSRNEFREDLKIHDFIPRGLYVVKDIVRRNKGILICRSKEGQVTFDFGAEKMEDKIRYSDNYFPGTLISIIFPSRTSLIKKNSAVDVIYNEEISNKLEFINLLKVYSDIPRKQFSNQLDRDQYLKENFFIILSSMLHEINNRNEDYIIYIDYAGIDLKLHDFGRSLLYFFSLSPLINEKVKVMLINISDPKTLSIFSDISKIIKNDPEVKSLKQIEIEYLCKPIPCILSNRNIFWIGVINEADSQALENILIGNPNFANRIENLNYYEGHFFEVNSENNTLLVNIPLYEEHEDSILKYIDRFILNEIECTGIAFDELIYIDDNGKKHDYNKIKLEDINGRWFLVSSGKYQKEFICFIEKLFIKEYRQLLANFLIFKFESSKIHNAIDKSISKILTVTLSSQLIGKEVRDIYNQFRSKSEKLIKLIPLSNYYEFDSEEPFKEIQPDDNVLVVNDVISTGKLSNEIYDSLKTPIKRINLCGILTVVDSRNNVHEFPQINDKVVELCKHEIEIRDVPDNNLSPIWINSIVNSPVTMPQRHSDDISILFEPEEFLELVDTEGLLQIGHIKRNNQHHTYLINQTNLYHNDKEKNYRLFKTLFRKINENKTLKDKSKLSDRTNSILLQNKELLLSINHLILNSSVVSVKRSEIRRFESNLEVAKKSIEKSISRIERSQIDIQRVIESPEFNFERPDFDIDFVFFPFLSSLTEIMDDLPRIYHEVNPKKLVEIYPIPRIMTPDGWRFSFPPKFLNNITKNSRVFIIDDGSWTGDTLIQMIDSISFLAVSEIFALSIVAKLDDFRREFYTRIQSIKSRLNEIPIHIFFGTHIHLPVYRSGTGTCPFINEEKHLLKLKSHTLPTIVKNYIEKRLEQIEARESSNSEKTESPTYIPANLDTKELFLIRNILGKYESYRFYKEDVEKISDIKTSVFSNIHYLMFIILHEPHLLKIIQKLDVSTIKVTEIEDYLKRELLKRNSEDTYWSRKSIVRMVTILLPKELYQMPFIKCIVDFVSEDTAANEFVAYYLFSIVLDKDNIYHSIENQKNVKIIIREIYEYAKEKYDIKHRITEAFRQVLNKIEIIPIGGENDVFRASMELEKIYLYEETEGEGHNSLDDEIERILNNIEDANNVRNWDDLYTRLKHMQKYIQVFNNLLHDCNSLKYEYIISIEENNHFINSTELIDAFYNENKEKEAPSNKEVTENLELIKVKVISPNSPCYKLFYRFGCGILNIWDTSKGLLLAKLESKRIVIRPKDNRKFPEITVSFHQDMLLNLFYMFFDNISKYVPEETVIEYALESQSNNVIMTVIQNCPINIGNHYGLGLPRIKTIISFYKGSFQYDNKEDEGVFEFKFKK